MLTLLTTDALADAWQHLTARIYFDPDGLGYRSLGNVRNYAQAPEGGLRTRNAENKGCVRVNDEQADELSQTWTFELDEDDADTAQMFRLALQLPDTPEGEQQFAALERVSFRGNFLIEEWSQRLLARTVAFRGVFHALAAGDYADFGEWQCRLTACGLPAGITPPAEEPPGPLDWDYGPCAILGLPGGGGDTFDCYPVGPIPLPEQPGYYPVTMSGGTGWSGLWIMAIGIYVTGDDFQTYPVQSPIGQALSDGSGWSGDWAIYTG